MEKPLHYRGDSRPLPKSPTGQYWRVETPFGYYVGTFATERAARAHVATLPRLGRDYSVSPLTLAN